MDRNTWWNIWLKRARRMGALCRPRRLMRPMTTWRVPRPMSCGLHSDRS